MLISHPNGTYFSGQIGTKQRHQHAARSRLTHNNIGIPFIVPALYEYEGEERIASWRNVPACVSPQQYVRRPPHTGTAPPSVVPRHLALFTNMTSVYTSHVSYLWQVVATAIY